VSALPLVVEERVKAIARERAEQLYKRFINDAIRMLRGGIDSAEKNFRRYRGLPLEVSVNQVVEGDTIKMYIEARLAPEAREIIYKIVENELMREVELTKIRLDILKRLLVRKLESATGGLGAVLHNYRESPREGSDKAGGGGEEVRDQEGGSGAEGAT
jgi:hypothetical protein